MVNRDRKGGNLSFTEGKGTHEEALYQLDSALAIHSLHLHRGERADGIFPIRSETELSVDAWEGFAGDLARRLGVDGKNVKITFPC